MSHVMREELVRWRDHGLAQDRDRVVSHLATCKSCAAMYAELIRTAPATDTPARFDPADFVQRGYAVRRARSARAWSAPVLSWKVWAGALGAAAVLLLMVVAGPGPRSEPPDLTRGASIELLMSGTPERPTALEWKSGIAAPRYRVELRAATGAVVYQTVTEASRVSLPAEVTSTLGRGGSYTWTVTALDADGRPITAASKTLSFAGD